MTNPTKPGSKDYSDLKDSQGRYRTQSLFYETNDIEQKYPSCFTLKPFDHMGRVSMRRRYLEIADPTEYLFAMEMFGFWEHWQKLTGLGWFSEYVKEWREELATKLKAEAIKHIKEQAKSRSPAGLSAAKWLAEGKYDKSPPKGRGRPTNEEKKGHLAHIRRKLEEEQEDAKRIGLLN